MAENTLKIGDKRNLPKDTTLHEGPTADSNIHTLTQAAEAEILHIVPPNYVVGLLGVQQFKGVPLYLPMTALNT